MASHQDPVPTDEQGTRSIKIALGILALGVGTWLAVDGDARGAVGGLVGSSWQALQTAPPIAFFSVLVIASLLPIPISLLYVTAGTLYGIVPALLWIAPSILLTNLIVHFASTSFVRPRVERFVLRRGYAIPRLESKADQTLFITLVRITPGIPYFLQNLVLGLADLDLLRFLLISVVVHMMYVTGFVVLGRSAFEGELGLAVVAVALLVAVSIIARIVHTRLQARRAERAERS